MSTSREANGGKPCFFPALRIQFYSFCFINNLKEKEL